MKIIDYKENYLIIFLIEFEFKFASVTSFK